MSYRDSPSLHLFSETEDRFFCFVFFECILNRFPFPNTECFKKTMSIFGGLDIVVNNAGVGTTAGCKRIFAINTVSLNSKLG